MKRLRSVARVAGIAGAAIMLATACSPGPPPELAAGVELPIAFVTAPLAGTMADSGPGLRTLIRNPPAALAGERLNADLLERFYARRGFAPVWSTRAPQAELLAKMVLAAGDHGLDPALFHAGLLRSRDTLPPPERELLLSSAVLSYADALARGAVPVERRKDNEVLAPGPVDVAATLEAALDNADPVAAIEALAPATPTYRLLRGALRTTPGRGREIAVNLERERWLPRRLPPDRVWVNAAEGRLVLFRDDRPVFSTRVIVGREDQRNQTPEFQATITGIVFNPPWNIPADIARDEILPKAHADPGYLTRYDMVVLADGSVQQRAGPGSALGHLMFEMDNKFDVYLHDTPSKDLFGRDNRRVSHGCIRVENPRQLAALLMRQPADAIDQAIAPGGTTRSDLPKPVPVFVVYETAFADSEGRLQYRADAYGRDGAIAQALDPKRRPAAVVRIAQAGR